MRGLHGAGLRSKLPSITHLSVAKLPAEEERTGRDWSIYLSPGCAVECPRIIQVGGSVESSEHD